MSGKVFSRVRGGGFFKRADIVVYALIAVVAIVLLLVFLLPSDEGLSGFEITYDGATVLTYDFDDGLTVKDAFRDAVVTTEGDGGLYLTVTTADGPRRAQRQDDRRRLLRLQRLHLYAGA